MTAREFYEITPRAFFAKLKGYRERTEAEMKDRWERTRWQTFILVGVQMPKNKRIKPTDLITFPWEKEYKKRKIVKHTPEELKKHFDFMPDVWPKKKE